MGEIRAFKDASKDKPQSTSYLDTIIKDICEEKSHG